MSRKWIVVSGLFVVAAICGLLFIGISSATVMPMLARGTGENGVQVTNGGWLALMTSVLGTGGFSLAGIVAIFTKFAESTSIGSPATRKIAVTTIDVGALAIYSQLHSNSKDPAERQKIREAAKVLSDSQFETWFPVEAKT